MAIVGLTVGGTTVAGGLSDLAAQESAPALPLVAPLEPLAAEAVGT